MAQVPPAQVAKNIENAVLKFSKDIHSAIYANAHKHSPAVILAALGGKAQHVTAMLASADAVAVTPAVAPAPVVPQGS